MASTLSSLSRRYSTLRNALPFLVRQRYITNASLPLPNTRSRSNRSIKSICVSQHCVLKELLLMWSSPAALENVKSSASKRSTGSQSFFSHAAYHLRMVSSFLGLSVVSGRALTLFGMPAAAASAYGAAPSTVRRDMVVFLMTLISRFSLRNNRTSVYDRESSTRMALRHCGRETRQSGYGGRPNSAPEIMKWPPRHWGVAELTRRRNAGERPSGADKRF